MERSRFEDNLRRQFEEREIKPSVGAWEKLAKDLNKKSPKKSNFRIWYAAAGMVGVILLTTFFFNSQNNMEPELVVTKEVPVIKKEPIHPKETISDKKSKSHPTESTPIAVSKPESHPEKIRKSEDNKPVPESRAVAELSPEDEKLLDEWAAQVASSIKALPEKTDLELVDEVETMLADARRELFIQKTIQNSQVDATALLEEVEWELDKSFRERIFDFLGDKYDKLKTAISLKLD